MFCFHKTAQLGGKQILIRMVNHPLPLAVHLPLRLPATARWQAVPVMPDCSCRPHFVNLTAADRYRLFRCGSKKQDVVCPVEWR